MTREAGAVPSSPRLRRASSDTGGSASGTSVLEILVVMALGLAVIGGGVAALTGVREERAGREAARLLMHELQAVAYQARFEGRALAIRLSQPADSDAMLQVYADGNGNGVRVNDVMAGVDPPVGPPRRAFTEGRARLAIVHDVPTTDQQGVLSAGDAPVRFGVAPYIAFSPRRTGPSGSIYIAGPSGRQYAIRVLGTTGRLRLLCVDIPNWQWNGC